MASFILGMSRRWYLGLVLGVVFLMSATGCQAPAEPVVREVEVIKEVIKEVPKTTIVEVEKITVKEVTQSRPPRRPSFLGT